MFISLKPVTLTIAILLTLLMWWATASAQSGRAVMRGYVAFEGLAYVDKQPRAKIELCSGPKGKDCGTPTLTDEHGLYEISPAPLGEWWLRISAPGFNTYEISIYLPSDFIGNLAVMLKRSDNKSSNTKKVARRTTLARIGACREKGGRPVCSGTGSASCKQTAAIAGFEFPVQRPGSRSGQVTGQKERKSSKNSAPQTT